MSLWEQVEGIINETVNLSKQAFEKARELGSITKKEFEIKGLQSQVQKAYTRMGAYLHQHFSEERDTPLTAADGKIAAFLQELAGIDARIKEKEAELSVLRKTGKPDGTVDATPDKEV